MGLDAICNSDSFFFFFCETHTQGMTDSHALHCGGLGKYVIGRWKEGVVFVDI